MIIGCIIRQRIMAQLLELPKPPYRNIKEYFEYKQGAKSDKND